MFNKFSSSSFICLITRHILVIISIIVRRSASCDVSYLLCVQWWDDDDERLLFIVSDSDTFCAVKHNFQYWHVYWIFFSSFLKTCDKWRHIVTYARRLLFRIFYFSLLFLCVKKSLNYTFFCNPPIWNFAATSHIHSSSQ